MTPAREVSGIFPESKVVMRYSIQLCIFKGMRAEAELDTATGKGTGPLEGARLRFQ